MIGASSAAEIALELDRGNGSWVYARSGIGMDTFCVLRVYSRKIKNEEKWRVGSVTNVFSMYGHVFNISTL